MDYSREDRGEPRKKKPGEKFARHGRKSGIMVVIGTAECTGIRVSRVDSFFLRIVSKPESFACLPAKKKKKRRKKEEKKKRHFVIAVEKNVEEGRILSRGLCIIYPFVFFERSVRLDVSFVHA